MHAISPTRFAGAPSRKEPLNVRAYIAISPINPNLLSFLKLAEADVAIVRYETHAARLCVKRLA